MEQFRIELAYDVTQIQIAFEHVLHVVAAYLTKIPFVTLSHGYWFSLITLMMSSMELATGIGKLECLAPRMFFFSRQFSSV